MRNAVQGLIAALMLMTSMTASSAFAEEIRIKPLSKSEIRQIRSHLLKGEAIQESLARDNSDDETACPLPAFFGLNTQGYVTVPEDYANPHGRQIKVFYYGRVQPGKGPVVFFNGGPASDSHGSANILENYFIQAPEVHQQSFVYIDQRGTGCSDAFPSDPTEETVERLTHYTSENIVRDSEVVREKLFGAGSKWKIFGQSYGGLIVHRYALEAPQSVQGAFAHGFSLMKDQTQWLTLRIKSQKRVLEIFFQQYPDDRARLTTLRQLIKDDLCFNDGETKICGPDVLDGLTMYLGFSTYWSHLDSQIKKLLNADNTLSMNDLTTFVRNIVFGTYSGSGLAGSVISIAEISGGESDQDACKKVNQTIASEGDHPEAWLINECRLLAGLTNDKWTELLKGLTARKQMTPEMFKASLEQNPALPFFLYSGEKDVFVPYETFAEELATVGGLITYRQFPNSGHEGFYTERQVWKDLVSVP